MAAVRRMSWGAAFVTPHGMVHLDMVHGRVAVRDVSLSPREWRRVEELEGGSVGVRSE
jgi:hypothetical protein